MLKHAMKTEKRQAEKAGMNILGDLPLDFAGTDFMERFRIQVQELGIQDSCVLV